MKITPYLNFPGNCREALAFYEQNAGAKTVEHSLIEGVAPLLPVDGEPKRLPFLFAAHVRHRFLHIELDSFLGETR